MAGEWPGGRVLGVDACRAGWIGIVLGSGRVDAYTAARIDDLIAAVCIDGRVDVVAIDIPIGLPDSGPRQADELARAAVGAHWPSVFKTPVRPALQAPDHATAIAINRRLTGAGVSAQAFGLRAKLLQVDAWVRDAGLRVVEVHPEVSFAALAGAPLSEPKTTWAGATHRRRLLAEAGIELPDDLGPAGAGAAVDDVLDAAAAAWTARRVAYREAGSMPDPPEIVALLDGEDLPPHADPPDLERGDYSSAWQPPAPLTPWTAIAPCMTKLTVAVLATSPGPLHRSAGDWSIDHPPSAAWS